MSSGEASHDLEMHKLKQEPHYLGFSDLPNQIHRKSVRRELNFNLMVLGQPGSGKSTFVNSLLKSDFYGSELPSTSKRMMTRSSAINLECHSVLIKEKTTTVRFNLVDAPGLGQYIDNSDCWLPILAHVQDSFDRYMRSESRIDRDMRAMEDQRIHACVYFIVPTSVGGISDLDMSILRNIHDKMNVILVIGKADTVTKNECLELKRAIREELKKHSLHLYQFPRLDASPNDELGCTFMKHYEEYQNPFTVIGSNNLVMVAGKPVRARQYPWGVVEIERLENCDLAMLRYLLLSVNLQDLINTTHGVHYERYRCGKMSSLANESNFQLKDGLDPMLLMDAERREHEARLGKMRNEMDLVFEQKLREKQDKLDEKTREVDSQLAAMNREVTQLEEDLQARRAEFESEKLAWEEVQIAGQMMPSNGHQETSGDSQQTSSIAQSATLPNANNGSAGLGDRVLGELLRDKSKTKKRGIF